MSSRNLPSPPHCVCVCLVQVLLQCQDFPPSSFQSLHKVFVAVATPPSPSSWDRPYAIQPVNEGGQSVCVCVCVCVCGRGCCSLLTSVWLQSFNRTHRGTIHILHILLTHTLQVCCEGGAALRVYSFIVSVCLYVFVAVVELFDVKLATVVNVSVWMCG